MVAQPPAKPPARVSRWFWTACVVLWVIFGAVLVVDPSRLLDLGQAVRDLPLVVEVVVWILFLPWMVGLWIWQLGWAAWLRVALIVAVAVGGAVVFYPRPRRRTA